MMTWLHLHWAKLLLVGALPVVALGGDGAAPDAPAVAPQGETAAPAAAGAGTAAALIVENYQNGYCTRIDLDRGGQRQTVVDSCRGWSVEGCRSLLLASEPGVRADNAVVIAGTRSVSVPDAVNAAVARRFGAGNALLHLDLQPATCRDGRFAIPFEGSYMAEGAEGSASPMRGTAVFDAGGEAEVSIER